MPNRAANRAPPALKAPRLVVLDHHGVVSAPAEDQAASADDFEPLPGALEAIARLSHAGFQVLVVANQSGLGRGVFDVAALNCVHASLHRRLAAVGGRVEAIFYCPHAPEEGCNCRLPQPGLLLQIGERYGIDLRGVPLVSGRAQTLEAATAAGCEPHLVLRAGGAVDAGRLRPVGDAGAGGIAAGAGAGGVQVHADLDAFAAWVIERAALRAVPAAAQGGTPLPA